jgi:glyoxylase-like metal-dependent hydrolase (beta-lactamase superfamily II)
VELDVRQLPLGPFPTNCYLVRLPGAAEAAVVDPGWPGTAADIRLELAGLGGRCAAILVTHGDLDHIGGVAELAEGTGAEVWMADAERDRLERANDFKPAGFEPVTLRSWTPEHPLSGDETFEAAGIDWETVLVPGHTPAHLAYYTDGHLFSGDVLFASSVGRTDREGGSHETLIESIRTLVNRFPPETVVYPGHGPVTTLGVELETNPFLADLRRARS